MRYIAALIALAIVVGAFTIGMVFMLGDNGSSVCYSNHGCYVTA